MDKSGRILVVDDDPMVLEAIQESFREEYETVPAGSGAQALEILKADPDFDAIVLDIRMARMDGLQTAGSLKEISPTIPIIFHTGFPGDYSQDEVERRYQPFDYIGKNEPPIRLRRAVRNAVTFHRLQTSKTDLIDYARDNYGMVGKSRDMRTVYQRIERIGPSNSKVMILGPTGAGKELVAQAIHRRSNRSDRPLMKFNCSRKNPMLVDSELFGHVKGAFTGAVSDRIGMFEAADGGTLFLDEIGDLDVETQTKILRVIESGELTPVGHCEVRQVDVRVICATHHDLAELVREGRFRHDLYYRLNVVTILVPPLKDRKEDIPDLLDFFIERYCAESGRGLKVFEPTARALLVEYDWPGNVRQLAATVQSLIDLAPGYYITREEVANHLNYVSHYGTNGDETLSDQVRDFKRTVIIQALDRHRNNIAAAARSLGVDQANLRRTISKLEIELN